MKLRIKGSTLRLRLAQGEVRQLMDSGEIAEEVIFGPGAKLTYRLLQDRESPLISATYIENIMSIRIPLQQLATWAGSDEVTLAHSQPNGMDQLRIVVEKDWACLAPRSDEDESDNFPHPQDGTGKAC